VLVLFLDICFIVDFNTLNNIIGNSIYIVLLESFNVLEKASDRFSGSKERPDSRVNHEIRKANSQQFVKQVHSSETVVDEEVAAHELVAEELLCQEDSGVFGKYCLKHGFVGLKVDLCGSWVMLLLTKGFCIFDFLIGDRHSLGLTSDCPGLG
jgi:hypothetical protein